MVTLSWLSREPPPSSWGCSAFSHSAYPDEPLRRPPRTEGTRTKVEGDASKSRRRSQGQDGTPHLLEERGGN